MLIQKSVFAITLVASLNLSLIGMEQSGNNDIPSSIKAWKLPLHQKPLFDAEHTKYIKRENKHRQPCPTPSEEDSILWQIYVAHVKSNIQPAKK